MDEVTSTENQTENHGISREQIQSVQAVDLEAEPEAPPQATGPEGHGPGQAQHTPEKAFSWDDQTRESRRFCTGVFGAAAGTCDLLDVPVSLTDAEVQELGEIWGNVLRHFVEIQQGEMKADAARAMGETSIIMRKKVAEMQEARNG